MPRGQKSKLRAREKRRQAREESKNVSGGEATVAEGEESPASSPESKALPEKSSTPPALHKQQEPGGTPSSMAAAPPVSPPRSKKGTKTQAEEEPDASEGDTEHSDDDPLEEKVAQLVNFLLHKYQVKEPVSKAEMMKNVMQTYKNFFPEALRKASNHLELLFGLEIKEVDPKRNIYVLINKLEVDSDIRVNEDRGIPITGLLMIILSVIFSKGNCAAEEQVWEVLSMLGVFKDQNHFIFGDPKKLITEDLVAKKYLVYQQVPGSDPPHYQLLWGSRAYAETSKMKAFEFLCKIHDCVESDLEALYQEALKDEEERAQARAAAKARSAAMASSRCKGLSGSSSSPQ